MVLFSHKFPTTENLLLCRINIIAKTLNEPSNLLHVCLFLKLCPIMSPLHGIVVVLPCSG